MALRHISVTDVLVLAVTDVFVPRHWGPLIPLGPLTSNPQTANRRRA